jgi:hypothetical protein
VEDGLKACWNHVIPLPFDDIMSEETNNNSGETSQQSHITPVTGLYENWFLDYASYVILERAVPAIEDGLKPVQRRKWMMGVSIK